MKKSDDAKITAAFDKAVAIIKEATDDTEAGYVFFCVNEHDAENNRMHLASECSNKDMIDLFTHILKDDQNKAALLMSIIATGADILASVEAKAGAANKLPV